MSDWKVPINRHGGVIRFVHDEAWVTEWVSSDTRWQLELQLGMCDKGRSAVWFNFHNAKDGNQVFPFSASQLVNMLKQTAIVNGCVLGTFAACKQGTSYSMRYLGMGDWDAKL